MYVAAKLRSDPLTRLLATLPFDLGSVLDAGAGRGQFGLFLVELGRCRELSGFDGDERKVKVAQLAASDSVHFEQRDLLALPEAEVDAVLLIDVLHYLPLLEQDDLLRACARVARAQIVIRELDAVAGARNFVTRAGEWLTKLTGYNRGRAARHYRPASAITEQLERLGFSCNVQSASKGTPFGNVLIVATCRNGP
jgi:2-polyprenyl-3-methyl-5-hydroxy-6-metoxy-1,4-benzoquinol methylase